MTAVADNPDSVAARLSRLEDQMALLPRLLVSLDDGINALADVVEAHAEWIVQLEDRLPPAPGAPE